MNKQRGVTPKNNKRVIVLEFNELCPPLLHDFMARGRLPNFQRLFDQSVVYTTDAGEEAPNLEPWIQWLSIHSGQTFTEHGVSHLADGRKFHGKCVAELLSDAGVSVGVFGSMNVNYRQLNGYVVPDPWDREQQAHPAALAAFSNVVSKQVKDSSQDGGLNKGEMLAFGAFMARNGLRPRTVRCILAQLWSERFDPGIRWRRASLLERLQYDLFSHLNRKFKVQFATFFANSTAHYQHYYWRNMQPEIFEVPPPDTDHPSLKNAILYGYQQMDEIVSWFLHDYPDAVLVLVTALSQQAWVNTTKCTFRPRDFAQLLQFAGIEPKKAKVAPVMAEEFHIEFPSAAEAIEAEQRFSQLSVDGRPLMKQKINANDLFTGCAITDARTTNRMIRRDSDGAEKRFGDVFHMVHSMRSGRHHPHGVLWIRAGHHRVVAEKVPIINIGPTYLSYFGVPQPASMRGRPISLQPSPAELATA